MADALYEQVRQIAADIFGLYPEDITPGASPDTIHTWDSVKHLNVVLAIEQALGTRFAPEEIEQIKDFGSLVELARKKRASSGGP
jgi:acyl carrier protein